MTALGNPTWTATLDGMRRQGDNTVVLTLRLESGRDLELTIPADHPLPALGAKVCLTITEASA